MVQGLLTGAVDFIVDGIATALPLVQERQGARAGEAQQPAAAGAAGRAAAGGRGRTCRRSPTFRAGPAWWRRPARRAPIVDKIQREVVARCIADPAVFRKLEGSGITAVSSTPEEFEAFFRKEAVRWDTAFRESGIRLD